MPHWDNSVSLGTLLIILGIVMAWGSFKARVDILIRDFEEHKDQDREDFHEVRESLTSMNGRLQRVIGRDEIWRRKDLH